MNMPRFTADLSIYKTSRQYLAGINRTGRTGYSHSAGVVPSGWIACGLATAGAA
jgi:hypothetical protein